MAMYVYNTRGEPVGFVMETFIHTMDGQPIGRIIGSRVHRFDGSYVGEWWKDMVVSRPEGQPRDLHAIPVPPRRVPPGTTYNRRVVIHGGYRDMFPVLAQRVEDTLYEQAAE
jgi:sporulation protein YlmC with PRC-barrel domain